MAEARRLFGNPTRSNKEFYQSRSWFAFGVLIQNIRFGLRVLAKNPGASALTVLTLALALGVNTAIFSVLDSALLQWLPNEHPNKLVMLTDPNASMVLGGLLTGERTLLTFPDFTKLRTQMKTVSGLCASQLILDKWPIEIHGAPQEQVRGRLVSENYFVVFAVHTDLGRFFTQNDARRVGTDPYAVISYDYWQTRFRGNAAVLGTSIRLRHSSFVVIGVAAKNFRGETVGQEPDLWIPLSMQPLVTPGIDGLKDTLGDSNDKLMWLHAFGRRRSGVAIPQVQAEVNVLFRRILAADYPDSMQPGARKEALHQNIIVKPLGYGAFHGRKEFSEQWLLLLGLASLVLLVACANVANLLLARSAARAREVAVRQALGAARWRLIFQFMTESLLLAILGGGVGLAVAELVIRALAIMLSTANPDFTVIPSLDLHILASGLLLAFPAALLFGLAPALRATGDKMQEAIKASGRGAIGSRERVMFAKALVIAQVALSLMLAIGGGLFVRTLHNLQAVPLGYPVENLLLIQVDSWNAGYQGDRNIALYRELVTRLQETPGVIAATYSDRGLFSGFDGAFPVSNVEGFTSQKEADKGSTGDSVGPWYFSTVRIPILLGREFTPQDINGPRRVCVVNEAFSKHFFGGDNPIGKHFTSSQGRLEIIGVARDVRVQSFRGPIDPKFYTPGGESWLEVRTVHDPSPMLPAIRAAILSADPALSIQSARTLTQTIAMQNAQPRLIARLAGGFAVLALIIAAVGIYGLLSYSIAHRTNEIGIRVALGANHRRIAYMILRETGLMLLFGLVAGVALTVLAARLFANQLYGFSNLAPRWSLARYEQADSAARLFGVNALDPLAIVIAASALCAIGLLAACVPATRAAHVDPVSALRAE